MQHRGQLVDDGPVMVDCTLGGRYHTRAMIDNGCTGYAFVDTAVAHEACDVLGIEPLTLNKPRDVKGYNGELGDRVTQAIYPFMKIQGRIESPTPLMIIKLQHLIILGKP